MVEGASSFGAALLPQRLDSLLSATEKCILNLSRHFAGECKAICPPIEVQQKLGDATGQRPKTQK
jgi:hypothetical protein